MRSSASFYWIVLLLAALFLGPIVVLQDGPLFLHRRHQAFTGARDIVDAPGPKLFPSLDFR